MTTDAFRMFLLFNTTFSHGGCAYYPEKSSRERYVVLEPDVPRGIQGHLMAMGYRRYGQIYYRPECLTCSFCEPMRVSVPSFAWKRHWRRTLKHAEKAGIEVRWSAPELSREKVELYVRYQTEVHANREKAEELVSIMMTQMYSSPSNALELTLLLDNKLLAMSIVDESPIGLSAVYTAYDPAQKIYSPGTLAILNMMQYAALHEYEYLYLGLFLRDHPDMDYKKRFGPAEKYTIRQERWEPLLP